jgi:hypothetical protein
MPASEADDIVLELRSHRRAIGGGRPRSGALLSLGDPTELARQYRTESVATRAECGGSPITILHSLLLLRRESLAAWVVLALAAFGYAWALALGAAAIEKILSPHDVGLWIRTGGVSLPRITVDGPGPPGTREMLGWWFVPFGAVACAALLALTRRFALWWIRRSRAGRDSLPT